MFIIYTSQPISLLGDHGLFKVREKLLGKIKKEQISLPLFMQLKLDFISSDSKHCF